MALYTAIDACRACGSTNIPEVLNLGDFALSDFKDSPDAHTDRAPLVLVRCEDCTLVQLQHTVNRERLYANYWYRSSTQPAMVRALQDVARDAQQRVQLLPGDVVVDIGANDGTLLAQYPAATIKLAYEPALNLWAPLLDSGAVVVGGFFPPDYDVAYRRAKVVTSIACFYDVDDPGAFVEGIKRILAEDGVWINQMAYLPDTLRTNNFGDICHEHLTYWDERSFSELLAEHDMHVECFTYNDVNGGSFRTVVRHGKNWQAWASISDLSGFRSACFRSYGEMVFIDLALVAGKTVVGYGASTKGSTYLQWWQMGPDRLQYIADRNPAKWGKYTPTGQKVISEEEMRAMKPDYLLVLPWHFLEAFKEREADLLSAGTRFIVPFPTLTVVGGTHADLQPALTAAESRA